MDLELHRLGFRFINWHLCRGRRPRLHLWNGALYRLAVQQWSPAYKGEGSSWTRCPQHTYFASISSMCFLRKFTLTKATINSVQLFDESVFFFITATVQIRKTFTHTYVRCFQATDSA